MFQALTNKVKNMYKHTKLVFYCGVFELTRENDYVKNELTIYWIFDKKYKIIIKKNPNICIFPDPSILNIIFAPPLSSFLATKQGFWWSPGITNMSQVISQGTMQFFTRNVSIIIHFYEPILGGVHYRHIIRSQTNTLCLPC